MNRFKKVVAALGIATMLALPATGVFADDTRLRTMSPEERAHMEAMNSGMMPEQGSQQMTLRMLPPASFQDSRTGYMWIENVGWFDPRSGMIWNNGRWAPATEYGYRPVPPAVMGGVR